MRSILPLAFLIVLSAPTLAAQAGDACKGELWHRMQAWLGPQKTFQDTIAYLRKQKIDYAVFDARSAAGDNEDDSQPGFDPNGVTDCQPQKAAPQCSIVLSEPLPESTDRSAAATVVESDEIISIDFDATGKQTGHGCEVTETGM